MPAYDHHNFDPAAPVAYVIVRNMIEGVTISDVPMLIDTGADVTLLPHAIVNSLGTAALSGRAYKLVGFDGSRSFAPMAQLELVFCRRAFRGQFLLIEQDYGVLGRNVLNAVAILLDGPRLNWHEPADSQRPR